MIHSVLLVGLGKVAMGYDLESTADNVTLTHARAFATHPAFRMVGGVDAKQERRSLFAQHYGSEVDADLVAALERLKPDVVVIATPTESHGQVLRIVLSHASPRAVLCEKPLSYDLDEARDMLRLCEQKSCALYVNYLRRATPGGREVKQRLATGQIAGPIKGVAWYTKGLLHNGSHFVNLLEFWLGPIAGFSVISPGRWWNDTDPEPDLRIDFVTGSVAVLAAREEDYSLYEIDLVASNGRLRYMHGGGKLVWQAAAPDPLVKGYTVLSDPGEEIFSGGQLAQWYVAEQLAGQLAGTSYDLCSGADALQTLEWLMKIRTACERI
jgi:predicted dehydrogenase